MLLAWLLPVGGNRRFRKKSGENAPGARKPYGYLWKRIADQVARKPLEWMHYGKFLSMGEFGQFKNNDASTSNIAQEMDGPLRLRAKYEGFFADRESARHAETPYFSKTSKIWEVICLATSY